ncbi:MAG: protocatechuate 3,4-dioxygenase subunit alpha [Acidobacteriia bacterium]|nr:protocatechuate 3,4-dioxygenase subunit alpha [Terriglobia bacterium]
MDLIPTPSQTVGPYFHLGLTGGRSVARVAGEATKGERIALTFRVLDGDGAPINDAMIEIWQANAAGKYRHPDDPQTAPIEDDFWGFGRLATAEDGRCQFETIKPGRVPDSRGVLQAPHINVTVFARGLLRHLCTRVYFADDPANRQDPVLALVSEERRATLLLHPDPGRAGHWLFDVHLQGERETVFFDV